MLDNYFFNITYLHTSLYCPLKYVDFPSKNICQHKLLGLVGQCDLSLFMILSSQRLKLIYSFESLSLRPCRVHELSTRPCLHPHLHFKTNVFEHVLNQVYLVQILKHMCYNLCTSLNFHFQWPFCTQSKSCDIENIRALQIIQRPYHGRRNLVWQLMGSQA